MKIPEDAKKLIEKGIIYLGTSDGKSPNVTITQSGVIVGPEELLICDCEMTLAKNNILKNPNCCLAIYEKEIGYKIFG